MINTSTLSQANGAQQLVLALEQLGCNTVFGIPGIHNLHIYDALLHSSLRHVTARHEQGVGFMALGYARGSGLPGVALVITGPGLTNIATAMAQAQHDAVPLVVISTQLPRHAVDKKRGLLHELPNSQGFAASLAKESRRAQSLTDISTMLRDAYARCQQGRPGPVHLEIPLDLLAASSADDENTLEAMSQTLQAAANPVLLVGGGASGAAAEIAELAEALSAQVISTVAGKGILPDNHPLSLGARLHLPSARRVVAQSGVLLVIGSQLSDTDLWGTPLEHPNILHINIDPADFSQASPPSLCLEADAKTALQALNARIPAQHRTLHPHGLPREAERAAELQQVCNLDAEALRFIRSMLQAMRQALPRDGVLVTDMTTPAYVGISEFPCYQPLSYLHPVGFGSLGFALPSAIGLMHSQPARPVCVLVGDGGFQFSSAELAVAVEAGLPLPIVLFNDGGYGEIRREEERRHPGERLAVDIHGADFVALAQAYGAAGLRLHGSDADLGTRLQQSLQQALQHTVPTLIEVVAPWA